MLCAQESQSKFLRHSQNRTPGEAKHPLNRTAQMLETALYTPDGEAFKGVTHGFHAFCSCQITPHLVTNRGVVCGRVFQLFSRLISKLHPGICMILSDLFDTALYTLTGVAGQRCYTWLANCCALPKLPHSPC